MPHSILIVEDEIEIADTIKYALASEGMKSHWVSEGSQVATLLNRQSVDLVILDVGLPDINGFELLKSLRKQYDLPVIFLTARNDEIDRVIGLEIGADDYVTKPFSPRELVARVKAILKRITAQTQPTHTPFIIDQPSASIVYCQQPLELTRSEYHLLEVLLSRPGQVFSRRQLIEKTWSDQHPSDDRVIDTHIKAIRAKLKAINPADSPIETHRGFGYSLKTATTFYENQL